MKLVRELFSEIERNLVFLEELGQLSREDFTTDPRHYLLAERCLQLAIGSVLDIGFYLAAQWRREAPRPSIEEHLG